MRIGQSVVAISFLAAHLASAQSFDVASIAPAALWKAGGESSNSRSQIEFSADTLTMRNIDLNEMVQWVYRFQPYQISGNPLPDKRYDIRAQSGTPASPAEMRMMLQRLLASRFKLASHRAPKKTSVFDLVIAKGGPKLPPNKAAQSAATSARENLPRVVDGAFVFSNISITDFAEQLSQLRPSANPSSIAPASKAPTTSS